MQDLEDLLPIEDPNEGVNKILKVEETLKEIEGKKVVWKNLVRNFKEEDEGDEQKEIKTMNPFPVHGVYRLRRLCCKFEKTYMQYHLTFLVSYLYIICVLPLKLIFIFCKLLTCRGIGK
jgi:hypothetical protein